VDLDSWTDLLTTALNSVNLPGALCVERSDLFDPVPPSNPDREDIEATAPGSCRRCPSLTACRRWFRSLEP